MAGTLPCRWKWLKSVVQQLQPRIAGSQCYDVHWGGALLATAALKGHGLVFDYMADDSFLSTPWLQVAAIEMEILLGLWLLSGWAQRIAWGATVLFFTVVAGASLFSTLHGQNSCDCLGKLSVPPFVMLAVDTFVLIGLAICRPRLGGERGLRSPLISAVQVLAVAAALVLLAGATYLTAVENPRDALVWLRGERLTMSPISTQLESGPPGEIRQFEIEIGNHTDAPVRILGGTFNCACTVTDDLPLEIPAREMRRIQVKVRLAGTAGTFKRPFELYTNVPAQPRLLGWVTGSVAPPTGS
jgi:hypothetical protein